MPTPASESMEEAGLSRVSPSCRAESSSASCEAASRLSLDIMKSAVAATTCSDASAEDGSPALAGAAAGAATSASRGTLNATVMPTVAFAGGVTMTFAPEGVVTASFCPGAQLEGTFTSIRAVPSAAAGVLFSGALAAGLLTDSGTWNSSTCPAPMPAGILMLTFLPLGAVHVSSCPLEQAAGMVHLCSNESRGQRACVRSLLRGHGDALHLDERLAAGAAVGGHDAPNFRRL